jgi:putative transposase
MNRKRYTPEQIIGKLREAEVALAQGETAAQVCRTLGIAEQTFYRWRREYGGLKVEAIQVMPRDPGYARLRQDLWLDLTPILT